ncbi:phBC6A51 family helix-turn-helix protein [Brevibacillus laterosporus]|uniref:PhBC6A51 family helix-turn-helix protein n=1 Tax=Brevibacillus laterosporus TaxID=1465 RepID=A0AAP3DL70_BRELA|nr:phBC6A51 family helix-turn-helix protein [Brevibacillus laterosporus]MCR8982911.1 phBC6A51 family helix-turn-helix protein [Brevibacillus laterosporus]MCZ0810067.1 phBC6A51 family helix-turn-helix protein [Brevibacillus laterosporus]MCZ0828669.1 phBC6A51 family helix-turn-helix protein [Brevibacillus laterosporus]MCZ0853061.1 phBC6A51 family helix-turn-helix protein [Brevibacillus laterosporus]
MAKRLSPEQYVAIGYLAQLNNGGKTLGEIAGECGVSERTLYTWRQDPVFDRERVVEMRRNLLDKVPNINQAMIDAAVTDKNAAAAKLIYQQLGLLTDRVEVDTSQKEEVPDIDDLKRMIAEMDE